MLHPPSKAARTAMARLLAATPTAGWNRQTQLITVTLGVCTLDALPPSTNSYLPGPSPLLSALYQPLRPWRPHAPSPGLCHHHPLLCVCGGPFSLWPSLLLCAAGWQLLLPWLGPSQSSPTSSPPPFPLCSLPISTRPLPPPLSEAHQWQPILSSTSFPRAPSPNQPAFPCPQAHTPGHMHSFTCVFTVVPLLLPTEPSPTHPPWGHQGRAGPGVGWGEGVRPS